ncbi:MAG TPA: hypothetical protein VGF17_24505 [Phytomonospora sp.]
MTYDPNRPLRPQLTNVYNEALRRRAPWLRHIAASVRARARAAVRGRR